MYGALRGHLCDSTVFLYTNTSWSLNTGLQVGFLGLYTNNFNASTESSVVTLAGMHKHSTESRESLSLISTRQNDLSSHCYKITLLHATNL